MKTSKETKARKAAFSKAVELMNSAPKGKKLPTTTNSQAKATYKRNVDGPYLRRNIGLDELLDIAEIAKTFGKLSLKSSSSSSIARKSTLKK